MKQGGKRERERGRRRKGGRREREGERIGKNGCTEREREKAVRIYDDNTCK